MIFYNNWTAINTGKDIISLNPSITLEDIDAAGISSISQISKEVTKLAGAHLGRNPALCLSGGIDSQAAYQLWDKEFPIEVVIFEFENNLNFNEVLDAVRFAEKNSIDYKIVKLNVRHFLNSELDHYAQKYKLSSPQFAIHCKFLSLLKEQGYTGAVFGGNSMVVERDRVYFSLRKAQLVDLNNFETETFKVIPNFLSFNKLLCLKLILNTPVMDHSDDTTMLLTRRYENKIRTYTNLNLYIIPQSNKKTGFEQLKKYYEIVSSTPDAFDIKFRVPLYRQHPDLKTVTNIDEEIKNTIINYCTRLKQ